jgi:hypothetical protein
MAVTRNAVAFVSGQPDFAPQAVRLACPAPADAAVRRALARGLGAPLRWGAAQTALQLDAALLDAPTAIQDTQYAPLIRDTLARLAAPRDRARQSHRHGGAGARTSPACCRRARAPRPRWPAPWACTRAHCSGGWRPRARISRPCWMRTATPWR